MARTNILLVDDHVLVRSGLRRILEEVEGWHVVGEAGDGREALTLAAERHPNVVICDIALPRLNGIEAARQLTRRHPEIAVLVLSMHAEEAYVVQALQAGARGFLLKDAADTELVSAVSAVSEGKSYFSPAVARVMLDDYVRQLASKGVSDRYEALSEREREVFQLVAERHSNKEIATLLGVSPATVETHRSRVLEKLGLHSASDIVLYAVRRGIIR